MNKSLKVVISCLSLSYNVMAADLTLAAHFDKTRVAIIGGGGSGLTTAWLLEQSYDVTLYEKAPYLGGHAETVDVHLATGENGDDETVGMEAGFQFFTQSTAPYFNRLLNLLDVGIHNFQLSYTFDKSDHLDSSEAVVLTPFHNGKTNLSSFKPTKLTKLIQMQYVMLAGKKFVEEQNLSLTLEDMIEGMNLSVAFKNELFYPVAAAGWGVTVEEIKKFSAFDVLKTITQGITQPMVAPVYENIEQGTSAYIRALAKELTNTDVRLAAGISKISYANEKYVIEQENGDSAEYDDLVITTNSADAVDLLKDISETSHLRAVLSQIKFYDTTIAIHGDVRLMPKNRSDWSWANVRYNGQRGALTIYEEWKKSSTPVFKSWVFPGEEPMPEPLYAVRTYRHPYIDLKYFQVQQTIDLMQGHQHLWLGGLYTYGVDSHESAIMSAIRIGKALAPQADRLKQLLDLEAKESALPEAG